MKTTTQLIVSSVLGAVLFAGSAFAGVNYIEYRKQRESTKGAAAVASPDSGDKQANKYLVRDKQGTALAITPVEKSVPGNKYLRSR